MELDFGICLLTSLLLMLFAESSALSVTIQADSLVQVTEPFNVTCSLTVSDQSALDRIKKVTLILARGRNETVVMEHTALAQSRRDDMYQTDGKPRYQSHGERQNTRATFIYMVNAAFLEDGGIYRCEVTEATEDSYPRPTTHTKEVQIEGNLEVELDYKMAHTPTTTTTTTTTTTATTTTTSIPRAMDQEIPISVIPVLEREQSVGAAPPVRDASNNDEAEANALPQSAAMAVSRAPSSAPHLLCVVMLILYTYYG